MKIITLSVLGAMLLTAGQAGAASRVLLRPLKQAERTHKSTAEIKKLIRPAAEKEKIWRAGTEKLYGWNGEEWDLEETYTSTYDNVGRTTEEVSVNYEGEAVRTTYTYNANGKLASEISQVAEDGVNFVNSQRNERVYDERITDLIVENKEWVWSVDDNDWVMQGNNYKRSITRNSDGNVTLAEVAVLFNGIYDPTQRLEITYGPDGKAATMKESVLDYDYANNQYYWDEGATYSNIVWESTNGQIARIDNLYTGENRLKSADVSDPKTTLHIEVSYNAAGYVIKMEGSDEEDDIKGTVKFEKLDDYGSYSQVTTSEYYYEGDLYYSESETTTEKYDKWGNLLVSRLVWTDETYVEVYEDIEGTVEYDEKNGYPLTYTVTRTYYDEELEQDVTENDIRIEFSDYADASAGISDMEIDAADAPVEYYNLQGIRVSEPAAGGVYIRRQGQSVSKVLVK